jgi:hypothetical protein
MAAGLGFLSEGQRTFSPIVFAGGTVIAGKVGNALLREGAVAAALPMLPIVVFATPANELIGAVLKMLG